MKIEKIEAVEILDSRGNPTIETKITLESGVFAKAAVPSGASTGSKEALELRDGDKDRFGGKGVLKACQNVNEIIAPKVVGMSADEQEEIDKKMLEIDGTENKSNLGANAILSVSLAVARVSAQEKKIPLWRHIQETYFFDGFSMPVPAFNIINGGAHADSGLDVQEFMVIPTGLTSFEDEYRAGAEIYQILRETLKEENFRVALGDEGGFAPRLDSNETALAKIIEVIDKSGYKLGEEIKTGMDVAASEFFDKKAGIYEFDGKKIKNNELADVYSGWIEKYQMELIEDPMSEFDWDGWSLFNERQGESIAVVGDDLTVTNKKIIKEAHEKNACNTILIKVNQIGSLTETVESIRLARECGMKIFVSHRSGETTDDFIADLAVATSADYVKFGAPARSERVNKYNRLLEIERSEKNKVL